MNNVLCSDAIVIDKWEDTILLVKRAYEPNQGKWALPGGHIETLESSRHAAIRETLEETGVKIKVEKLFGSFEDPFPELGYKHLVDVWFGILTRGIALTCSDESIEVAWWPIRSLPDLTPFHAIVLETYKTSLRNQYWQGAK